MTDETPRPKRRMKQPTKGELSDAVTTRKRVREAA